MKTVMISIQPFWVEKILSGEKTIEIRKTAPKYELPCKVYIYCTYGNMKENYALSKKGRVCAEFTLNEIEYFNEYESKNGNYNPVCLKKYCCLTKQELDNYTKGKKFSAWHINDLKIYDKPKELSEFMTRCKDYVPYYMNNCNECCGMYENGQCHNGIISLGRAPQSWCYVEEISNDKK